MGFPPPLRYKIFRPIGINWLHPPLAADAERLFGRKRGVFHILRRIRRPIRLFGYVRPSGRESRISIAPYELPIEYMLRYRVGRIFGILLFISIAPHTVGVLSR